MSDGYTLPAGFDHPFYFLRHGETDYNRERRFQGHLDVPLNAAGLAQAQAAAERLSGAPIARIVASPLGRARRTAEAVAARHDLEVEEDPDLMECAFGIHEGEPHAPWLEDYWRGQVAPEGGEDFWRFRRRTVPALARAVAPGPDTLIVAHGGCWFACRSLVTMTPDYPRMPNALPLRVAPAGTGWSVTEVG